MLLRLELGRRKLAEFLKIAWPTIEPARPLIWNWHLDAMCEHLEAVFVHKQIKRLLITIPPGCTKSKLVGTYLPAWLWLRQPEYRWLFVSNNEELATGESTSCRRLVSSQWYNESFKVEWGLRDDQSTKTWYETTAGGHRICKGMTSNVTGRKGDAIVIDDPNDAQKVQSAAERKSVTDSYDNAISDRLIDFKTGPIICIGQRTHEGDLFGHLLKGGGFDELRIPEEFKPTRRIFTSTGWTDPRTKEGEWLREEQFGKAEADQIKKVNKMGYEAKHQQQPRPPEGIRFKSSFFQRRWRFDSDRRHILLTDAGGTRRIDPYGEGVKERFGTADGAASAKTSADFTTMGTFLITDWFNFVWFGLKRAQLEIPEQPDLIEEEYNRMQLNFLGVEACASNRALLQYSQRRRMVVKELTPKGDKLTRATPAIVLGESGRIYLPDEDAAMQMEFPLAEAIEELLVFKGDGKDEHDDIADVLAYGVMHFNQAEANSGGSGGASVTKFADSRLFPTRPKHHAPSLTTAPQPAAIPFDASNKPGAIVRPGTAPTRPGRL